MAQRSITLSVNKWAQVDQNYPSIVTPMGSTYGYAERRQSTGTVMSEVFVGFSGFSSSLRKNRLYSATAKWAIQSSDDNAKSQGGSYSAWQPARVFLCPCESDFNPSSLMWSNKPGQLGSKEMISTRLTNLGAKKDVDLSLYADSATTEDLSLLAKNFLVNNTGYFYCAITGADTRSGTVNTFVHKTLENGSTVPYLTIVYDDSVTVKSQIKAETFPLDVNPAAAQTFSWYYGPAGDYHCVDENWVQSSAKFYWKKSTSSTWNQISISGNTKQVTIPANTFPTGTTVLWYLQGTDTEGTTTSTTTYAFSTASSQITPDSYPSGSNIDNRLARTFTWHFQSSYGNYRQGSATFHWRKQGTTAWNNINASGTTQSVSVPAYTFPAASTIEWYLSGTDFGGTSSTSQTKTFSTVTPKITATQYPSGSNVFSGANITFQWRISSNAGDHDQSS